MDAKTIIRLLDAGYTKEEISAMETVQAPKPAEPTPAPAPAPAPVPDGNTDPYPAPAEAPVAVATPAPTPQPTPTPAPEQKQPSNEDIMKELARVMSAVQAGNIAHSILPQGGYTEPRAEDALAEIIRPTFKERGNP